MARTESDYPGALDIFVNAATDFNPGDAIPSTDFERGIDAIKTIQTKLGITGGTALLDSAVTVNNSEADKDFRVAAIGATNALFIQGSDGKIGIGTAVIPHGGEGYAMLALEGTNANAAGPHIQVTTASDDYPLLQLYNWAHDEIGVIFDGYYDGAWKSSDAGSSFRIGKGTSAADKFSIEYDVAAAGAAITWNNGIVLDTTGLVTIQAAKLAVGATTPTAVQWGALGALVEWTDWTPTLTGDADLSGYTSARYYRLGDICFFIFRAENKNVTTSGTIQITLPFTSANTDRSLSTDLVYDGAAYAKVHCFINPNVNYISLYKTLAAGAWAGTENGVKILLSGFFEIA